MNNQFVKITSRSGSLIIWRGEQPHCNFPNNSNVFRINQYIRMMPAFEKSPDVQKRRRLMMELLSGFNEMTPLGRKLFGLDSWSGDQEYENGHVEV